MTTHKERLEAANKRLSLPKSLFIYKQDGHSNNHSTNAEKNKRQLSSKKSLNNESDYQNSDNHGYLNMQEEKQKDNFNKTGRSQKPSDRHSQRHKPTTIKTINSSNARTNMPADNTDILNKMLHHSRSFNGLKTLEPSNTFGKSTIHQEYHDKMVLERLSDISHGKARKSYLIALLMFFIFGLTFIVGLLLICLTYIYKNINFSLDKGEMIGPVFMAGSFVFLGIGVRFLFNAYRIAHQERRKVAYEGYDRRFVGLKSEKKGTKNEQLVSATRTDIGISRTPHKQHIPLGENQTLGRSEGKVYETVRSDAQI